MDSVFEKTAEFSPRKSSLETSASGPLTGNASDSGSSSVGQLGNSSAFGVGLGPRRPVPLDVTEPLSPISPKVIKQPLAAPVLSYGPHGSPKRQQQAQPQAQSLAAPVLSYGPHGSPQRRCVKAGVSTGPVLAPQNAVGASLTTTHTVPTHIAPPRMGPFAVFGAPPGLTDPVLVQPCLNGQTKSVLGYPPAGAAHLSHGMSPPKLSKPAAPECGAVLCYGPHGSPRKRPAKNTVAQQRVDAALRLPDRAFGAHIGAPPGLLSPAASTAAPTATFAHVSRPAPLSSHDLASPMKKDVPSFLLTSP